LTSKIKNVKAAPKKGGAQSGRRVILHVIEKRGGEREI
jgi:hypothetical protein